MSGTAAGSLLQNHPRKVTAALIAAAIAIATPLIQSQEGLRTVGYKDIVGVPTYCYGGTGPAAVVGKRYTQAECNTQFAQDAQKHADAIAPCITVTTPPSSLAAFVSFSYNVGSAGFCHSSVARDLNAGNLKGACAAMSAWIYAGGKPVQGLINRRAQERALCERGLTEKVAP